MEEEEYLVLGLPSLVTVRRQVSVQRRLSAVRQNIFYKFRSIWEVKQPYEANDEGFDSPIGHPNGVFV